MRHLVWGIAAALAAVLAVPRPASAATLPPVKHVFVIVLENKNSSETFAPNSPAPYLAHTLPAAGLFLFAYLRTRPPSPLNYIAMMSGQAPNADTQGDCQIYKDFVGPGLVVSPGQAVGQGCVYPATVQTLADQLAAKGLTWKGYLEDMGTPCRHPARNSQDDTQQAKVGDQYAARHNPFVYFHSIIDTPACAANDVPLDRLAGDLASVATTPNFSFITPNLCNDGHDTPTCAGGAPGGLVAINTFLQTWVPRILASPAYLQGGMLLITFDEAEVGNTTTDAASCCGETNGPNSPLPGIIGPGGGKTSAVVLSPWVVPGSVNNTAYNHYSFLRSMEDLFGLDHLGYAAADGLVPFGADVFNGPGPASASAAGTGATGPGSLAGTGSGAGANGRGALPATGGGQPSPWFALGLLALALASAAARRSVATQLRVPQPSCQRTFLRSFPGRHG